MVTKALRLQTCEIYSNTIEMAWKKWKEMCERWEKDYRAFKLMCSNADYKAYMAYLICPEDTAHDLYHQLD